MKHKILIIIMLAIMVVITGCATDNGSNIVQQTVVPRNIPAVNDTTVSEEEHITEEPIITFEVKIEITSSMYSENGSAFNYKNDTEEPVIITLASSAGATRTCYGTGYVYEYETADAHYSALSDCDDVIYLVSITDRDGTIRTYTSINATDPVTVTTEYKEAASADITSDETADILLPIDTGNIGDSAWNAFFEDK